MPTVTFDEEADILYVRLSASRAVRHEFLDDLRIVAYSEADAVVGIEFICATDGIDLSDVPFAQLVEDLIDQSGHRFKVFA